MVFALLKKEQEVGVLDVDIHTPSAVGAFTAGYIDKDHELCVGLQTDAPLKRSIKPKGGWRGVEGALKAYGFDYDPAVKEVVPQPQICVPLHGVPCCLRHNVPH